jgi:alanine-glyoxylate transaminase/serine-glyoxylate transaminase/serine-pyruvate transaminase
MTVAHGREFLSISGPTNIPDAVLQAMHRPAIDIYSGDMIELTRTLLEDLPRLLRTSGRTFIHAANGHGGWEADF